MNKTETLILLDLAEQRDKISDYLGKKLNLFPLSKQAKFQMNSNVSSENDAIKEIYKNLVNELNN